MLLKLLLAVFLLYWGYKSVKNFLNPPTQKRTQVKPKVKKTRPLDLTKFDVEDADFEDIDDK